MCSDLVSQDKGKLHTSYQDAINYIAPDILHLLTSNPDVIEEYDEIFSDTLIIDAGPCKDSHIDSTINFDAVGKTFDRNYAAQRKRARKSLQLLQNGNASNIETKPVQQTNNCPIPCKVPKIVIKLGDSPSKTVITNGKSNSKEIQEVVDGGGDVAPVQKLSHCSSKLKTCKNGKLENPKNLNKPKEKYELLSKTSDKPTLGDDKVTKNGLSPVKFANSMENKSKAFQRLVSETCQLPKPDRPKQFDPIKNRFKSADHYKGFPSNPKPNNTNHKHQSTRPKDQTQSNPSANTISHHRHSTDTTSSLCNTAAKTSSNAVKDDQHAIVQKICDTFKIPKKPKTREISEKTDSLEKRYESSEREDRGRTFAHGEANITTELPQEEEELNDIDLDGDIDIGFDLYDQSNADEVEEEEEKEKGKEREEEEIPRSPIENQVSPPPSPPEANSREMQENEEIDLDADTMDVYMMPSARSLETRKTSLDDLLDVESDDSDDEGNFKRRSSKDKANEFIESNDKSSNQSSFSNTQLNNRLQRFNNPQGNQMNKQYSNTSISQPNESSNKIGRIDTGPTSSSNLPESPASSSDLTLNRSHPPLPTSSEPTPSTEELISSISREENPSEAMKRFIFSAKQHTNLVMASLKEFQSLYEELLDRLFMDPNFFFEAKHLQNIFDRMRELNMNDSDHWEDIIDSWWDKHHALSNNQSKSLNINFLCDNVHRHLESEKIQTNIRAAKFLFFMAGLLGPNRRDPLSSFSAKQSCQASIGYPSVPNFYNESYGAVSSSHYHPSHRY